MIFCPPIGGLFLFEEGILSFMANIRHAEEFWGE